VVTDLMEDLYLGHLSADCNTPDHARAAVGGRLAQQGRGHVRVHDTAVDRACATLVWN
jgi:hypothetical protein